MDLSKRMCNGVEKDQSCTGSCQGFCILHGILPSKCVGSGIGSCVVEKKMCEYCSYDLPVILIPA